MKKTGNRAEEYYDMNQMSIVLFNLQTIRNIFNICLPNAGENEFQVHYRSMLFECRLKGNDAVLHVNVPTAFYNMDQLVSIGSIDFETDDIYESGEMVKPISMTYAKLLAPVKNRLLETFDTVEMLEIADNSIHRHPMDGGFSSTDLDTDLDEPGVIFRKGACTDLIQTDSVIYLGKEAKIVTSESRIATVWEDEKVNAQYVEVPTITYVKDVKDSGLRRMFDIEPTETTHSIKSDLTRETYGQLDVLAQDLLDLIPEPNLSCIIPERITDKVYSVRAKRTTEEESYIADQLGYNLANPADAMAWEQEKEWYNEY